MLWHYAAYMIAQTESLHGWSPPLVQHRGPVSPMFAPCHPFASPRPEPSQACRRVRAKAFSTHISVLINNRAQLQLTCKVLIQLTPYRAHSIFHLIMEFSAPTFSSPFSPSPWLCTLTQFPHAPHLFLQTTAERRSNGVTRDSCQKLRSKSMKKRWQVFRCVDVNHCLMLGSFTTIWQGSPWGKPTNQRLLLALKNKKYYGNFDEPGKPFPSVPGLVYQPFIQNTRKWHVHFSTRARYNCEVKMFWTLFTINHIDHKKCIGIYCMSGGCTLLRTIKKKNSRTSGV